MEKPKGGGGEKIDRGGGRKTEERRRKEMQKWREKRDKGEERTDRHGRWKREREVG